MVNRPIPHLSIDIIIHSNYLVNLKMHRNYLFPQIFVVTGEATAPPQSPHDAIDELVQQKPGEIDKNKYKMCAPI